MTIGGQERLLYKDSETSQKCIECGKETKRLVNTTEFEAEATWQPICSTDCELKFEEKVTGDDCGGDC